MIKFLILTLTLVSLTNAQVYYSVSKTTTLSGTAEVITIQQPAANSSVVRFIGAYIDSTVAVNITIERNGTAATSSSLVVNNINPGETTALTSAWSSSNVGTGTVISRMALVASSSSTIDLSKVIMIGSGINKNLTIRTSAITGTVNIVILYSEIP